MSIRIPIRFITVFGVTTLVALAVGIVFVLGLVSATQNTRLLMSDQAKTLIIAMERDIGLWLRPVHQQADWIAEHVAHHALDIHQLERFDEFMLGALAATDQVAGIALITPDALVRRWHRSSAKAVTADWSNREGIEEWIDTGRQRTEPSWVEPFFTDTIGKTILLHDLPIHGKDGQLLAMLAQIVPIEELSRHMVELSPREGMTPFVLYGSDRVLAHPSLTDEAVLDAPGDSPLIPLSELDDDVLQRIWTPDEEELFFLSNDNQLHTSGAFIRAHERFYVYLYRFIEEYGPTPWIIGAHLNTETYGGAEGDRLMRSLLAGLVVLLVAVVGAFFLGRYITRPVTAIAAAARQVEANELDEIPALPSSRMRELDDAARSFNQMVVDLRERTLIRQTLGQFVPEEVARSLLSDGGRLKTENAMATLLYSDIEGFTRLTETQGSAGVVAILNAYFSDMVEILERHLGVVTQFHGDAILATFNVPIDNPQHARSAILAAREMLGNVQRKAYAHHRLRIRIGIDTGPVVAGAVGAAGRLSYTVYGNSVNLAARLETLNKEFGTRLLISENTARLAGDAIPLRLVGDVEIRGQAKTIKAFTEEES
ncbi:adenylate/guanylate cyclase domain-containing protein [Granulosicoccus sp. 3-233]|uniref:adenylate/guanylate cyclase domain-containing protein n=1 Tax=Granulosicoccus sp. 3-233 TaxID=3417969 RepID=UPI003D3484EE